VRADDRWLIGLVAFLLASLSTAGAGLAADVSYCISTDGSPLSGCEGSPCAIEGLTSIGEALSAAADLPDLPDGARPSVAICSDGASALHETILIDNTDGQVSAPLALSLRAPLCPSPDADPTTPTLTWIGPWQGEDEDHDMLSVVIDRSPDGPCLVEPGPGIRVVDGSHLQVNASTVRGTSGYALRSTGSPGAYLQLSGLSLLDGLGPAIWADGHVSMVGSQVEGFLVGPSTGGAAVILSTGSTAPLDIRGSAVARNVIDSSDGVDRSVIRGHSWRLERLFVGLNLLGGDSSAVRIALAPRRLAFDAYSATAPLPIDGVVFSRNARTPQSDLPPPTRSDVRNLSNSAQSCAGADPAFPWSDESPPDAIEGGDGPVLVIDPGIEQWEFAVARTFFVENETGLGPVIEAHVGPEATLSVVQSTFGGNGAGPVVSFEGGQDGATLALLRNLFVPAVSDPEPHSLVSLETDPHGLAVSANAAPDGWTWSVPDPDVGSPLLGPDISIQPGAVIAGLPGGSSDCERHLAVCFDGSSTSCEHWDGLDLPCPLDAAVRWLLDPDSADGFDESWPWETDWFRTERSGWVFPGAQGGPCAPSGPPFDRSQDAAGEEHGDGDGFVDAIDCDNEDPDLIPLLPSDDGYLSPYCEEVFDDCFVCPADSLPPPSSGNGDETDEGVSWVSAGCEAERGCGFSWSTSSLVLLFLTSAGLRVRRPRRDGAEPSGR